MIPAGRSFPAMASLGRKEWVALSLVWLLILVVVVTELSSLARAADRIRRVRHQLRQVGGLVWRFGSLPSASS
jgi:hypothetical protein